MDERGEVVFAFPQFLSDETKRGSANKSPAFTSFVASFIINPPKPRLFSSQQQWRHQSCTALQYPPLPSPRLASNCHLAHLRRT
jgi:hypothetical protein